jgi:hypothetical protein
MVENSDFECDYYVCEGYVCECLEGFEADPSSATRCLAPVAPTPGPVSRQPCIDGDHGCDTITTQCMIESQNFDCEYYVCEGYVCDCLEGFAEDDASGGMSCAVPVAPTPVPPTPAPTTAGRPCLDGAHGCDTSSSICMIEHQDYECEYYVCEGYVCECLEGFVADPDSKGNCLPGSSATTGVAAAAAPAIDTAGAGVGVGRGGDSAVGGGGAEDEVSPDLLQAAAAKLEDATRQPIGTEGGHSPGLDD